MADYIKIPKDFKSLHELKDLVNNYDLISRLSNALDNYQRMYIEDYLMTLDDVLKYVPEAQQRSYSMQIRSNKIDSTTGNTNYVWEKAKNGKEVMRTVVKKHTTFADILKLSKVTPDEKLFLVNTVDKVVDVAYWAKPGRKITKIRGMYDLSSDDEANQKYTKEIKFEIDEEKRLTVRAYYTFTASQAVGGVRISTYGGNGYLSGESYNKYTANGHDIYKFCTRTNKYLGYFGCIEDKPRPHIKDGGRW